MKVGDLVRYIRSTAGGPERTYLGVVMSINPGWARVTMVKWMDGTYSSVEGEYLETVATHG